MIGYLDLPSGLSGDMFLGCLVDVGWPVDELRRVVAAINLGGDTIQVDAAPVMKGAIRAMKVQLTTSESHHHRHLADVAKLINSADLPQLVKDRSVAVFTRLAHAEAAVHGTTVEKIHFHEVGALDSIGDIVGVCAGVAALNIQRLYSSPVPISGGWIDSDHGPLPLPAPATLQLLASVHAPTYPAPVLSRRSQNVASPHHSHPHKHEHEHPEQTGPAVELVTPTAAALLAELATFAQPPMRLSRVGIGAGGRDFAWPNIARLWLGALDEAPSELVQVDTNIDDMNPQFFASVSDRLFSAGAVDVWIVPIQMKKGRPAVTLSVLCSAAVEHAIADLLLRQTTTLGVRVHGVHRHEAERQLRTVETPFGPVRIKLKLRDGQVIGMSPEYDDCVKLADVRGVPVKDVHAAALAAANLR